MESIKDLLLPREKYSEAKEKYGRSPFTFEIRKTNQVLYYFGANHSHDPKNHQYPLLKEYWKKFLEATTGGERVVLMEGNLRPVLQNEELAIKTGSEGHFITFLASQAKVPVFCPDIVKEEFLKGKSVREKEASLVHSFLSWVDQARRHENPDDQYKKELSKWFEYAKKRDVWAGMDISLERIKELYKEFVGKEFNEKDNHNYLVNPNRTDTKINEIARAHSDEREIKIVSEVIKYWNERKNIFIVFGSGHLVIQRPALEKLLI